MGRPLAAIVVATIIAYNGFRLFQENFDILLRVKRARKGTEGRYCFVQVEAAGSTPS